MKKILTLFILAFAFLLNEGGANAQSVDSSWPVFNANNRHTGVSPYNLGKGKKELLWSYKTGASVESSPVLGIDGIIYSGSHDGYLYALNPDGSLKWKLEVAKPNYDDRWKVSKAIMATPAIAKDGTIYINGSSQLLVAVNPDGTKKWEFPIKWSNDFWNAPNIGNDGTIYIGTARNDNNIQNRESGVYALNPDGTEKWHYKEDSGITVVPTVGDNGVIYAGAAEASTNKGRIIALDATGNKIWQFDLEQWLEGTASLGADGTIYTGSKEGYIYAITPEGKEKWKFKTGSGVSATPAVGQDGNIYIGSWDGNFYALDGQTGAEKWRFDVKIGRDTKLFEGYPGKETICTSAAISKDGVIIFADVFDTIYTLDLQGKELWRYKVASGLVSSPAISSSGTIYIGDEGGYIYAFGDKTHQNQPELSSTEEKDKNNVIITIFIISAGLVILTLLIWGFIHCIDR